MQNSARTANKFQFAERRVDMSRPEEDSELDERLEAELAFVGLDGAEVERLRQQMHQERRARELALAERNTIEEMLEEEARKASHAEQQALDLAVCQRLT